MGLMAAVNHIFLHASFNHLLLYLNIHALYAYAFIYNPFLCCLLTTPAGLWVWFIYRLHGCWLLFFFLNLDLKIYIFSFVNDQELATLSNNKLQKSDTKRFWVRWLSASYIAGTILFIDRGLIVGTTSLFFGNGIYYCVDPSGIIKQKSSSGILFDNLAAPYGKLFLMCT